MASAHCWMDAACLTTPGELPSPPGIKGLTRPCLITPLQGSMPHALLYDLMTTSRRKRTAEDALATGALTTSSYCAIASIKGFDDLYPTLLDLVGDNRKQRQRRARVREGHVYRENDYIV